MIGKTILNYEIKSLIGEGGMGNVYLAEHTQVTRKVAIKVLLPQFLKNEEIKTRFKNEASTLAHLQHPNIVGLFDYLEDESGMYLIMEYVEGVELSEHISKVTGPMPEHVAVPIMTQVLNAFSYAHAKGVVHRDIKPANILITKEGNVKILDFGIARILGEGNSNLTKTGTQMGTVYYMSPEQVQGKKVDIRSDIYSLGVTFYQMLTGVNPYKDFQTEYEVYSRIVKDELPPASQIYPGVPNYLESIVNRALRKEPADRFQNCDDFLLAVNQKSTQILEEKTQMGTGYVPPVSNSTPLNSSNASNSPAIFSLILAILCLFTAFIPVFTQGKLEPFMLNVIASLSILSGCLAIILGIKGLSNVRNNSAKSESKATAKTGLIIGSVAAFCAISVAVLFVFSSVLADPDGDGFYGDNDKCPNIAGTADGCKDTDGDGVMDSEDNCMDVKGDELHHGCPDTDGDGVYDDVDGCKNEKGDSENGGCPLNDADGDGVPDESDQCPAVAGTIENFGCPLTGSVVFWFDVQNSDYNYFSEYSEMKVVLGGKTKSVTSFSSTQPDCGDAFCATFEELEPGTHEYQVYDEYGNLIQPGTVVIYSKECVTEPITYIFAGE
jgi:serine/threonine protein kinase